jgi:hypothetical protein
LRVTGQIYPDVPMPYRLVEGLFRILRKPDRFNAIVGLPMAMLAAFGAHALLQHRRVGRLAGVLAVALGVLILIEYRLAPFPTVPVNAPAWFGQLAKEPGSFAILDLPMNLGPTTNGMSYRITRKPPSKGEWRACRRHSPTWRAARFYALQKGNRMDRPRSAYPINCGNGDADVRHRAAKVR